jgi:hypothetical protein
MSAFDTAKRGWLQRDAHEQLQAAHRAELSRPPANNPPELTRSTRVRCVRGGFYVGGAPIAVGDIAYVENDFPHEARAPLGIAPLVWRGAFLLHAPRYSPMPGERVADHRLRQSQRAREHYLGRVRKRQRDSLGARYGRGRPPTQGGRSGP